MQLLLVLYHNPMRSLLHAIYLLKVQPTFQHEIYQVPAQYDRLVLISIFQVPLTARHTP